MKKWLRTLCVFFVLILFTTFTGCQKEPEFYIEKNGSGTTCANPNMGEATFAYRDGFIYFCTNTMICEYDMETGKIVELHPISWNPRMLHVTDHYICYTTTNFQSDTMEWTRMTMDGKKNTAVFEEPDSFHALYADGMDVYYLTGSLKLCRRDLLTGQVTELLQGVSCYDMDETYIYAVVTGLTGEKPFHLFRAKKDTLDFEEIKLSFDPIAVFIAEDSLYLCSSYNPKDPSAARNRYQIYRYTDGVETPLPIHGDFYQVLDDCVIYLDDSTFQNSICALKSYNIKTGEETIVCEDVITFAILEDRYICCWIRSAKESWVYYDWQTGEMTQMYKKG